MSIELALHEAANNCARVNARATIVLRSGVEITGELEKPSAAVDATVHLRLRHPEGWSTVLVSEIAAVMTHR